MMLAATTRLRLRSWRFVLPFSIHASRSQKQAAASPGCQAVITRKTRGWAFWTLSVWENEESLQAFLRGSPHRETMPKLFPWCDEAVTVHWRVESPSLPSWEEATRELQSGGRLLRVQHPSPAQNSGVINLD
jgi:hypothetical protein